VKVNKNITITILVFLILLQLAVVMLHPAVGTYNDNIKLIINSWLGNRPKNIVKLHIHIPRDVNGKCFVLVRRFPTMYNPTEDGYTEKVYAGIHYPGDTVKVEKVLNMYVSKVEVDEKTGETRIGYYEPQEFWVATLCRSGNTTTYKWNRIVEVYPNTAIYRVDVYPSKQTPVPTSHSYINKAANSLASPQFQCSITQREYVPGTYRRGDCLAWIRGPFIYSLWSVNVRFGITGTPRSALYFDSYSDVEYSKPESEVDWSNAGKKLAYSTVTQATPFLTGPYKDRVYFHVRYIYEWGNECDSFAGDCYSYWLLYPDTVTSVIRSGGSEVDGIPNETSSYTPYTYCEYSCNPIQSGSEDVIWFYRNTYESDIPISSIDIMFSLYDVWSAGLSIDFYKAGRNDNQYTTPYVEIINNRDNTIYWWFDSNDPMTYTVKIYGSITRPYSLG
jgi:hypothetical protein